MILHDCLEPMQKFLIYAGVDRQECMVGDASKQSICAIGCFAIYQAESQAKQDTILELELKIEECEAKLNDMMNDKNELGAKVDNLIKEKTELQLLMSKEKSELKSELQTRNYQLQSQLKDMEEKLAVMESGNCEGNNHDEEDSESANLRAQLQAMKKEMGSLKGTSLPTFQDLCN